jgi:colanic acid/amylovoran biosynthesis glycosyltransferase
MRLAYLTSKYPSVSHTFIRRELREIERRGHFVLRLAIRAAPMTLVDPLDREEQSRTLHCLSHAKVSLLVGMLGVALARPLAFFRAVGTTLKMGWRSDRGLLRHLAYLVEAAYFLRVLERADIEHLHVHFGHNPAAVARLIRKMGGPPYSMTVHGIEAFDAPEPVSLKAKIEDALFVVAISDYGSAQLRRWVSPDQWPKIAVVHCAVGDDFLSTAAPIEPTSNTLVCVGRLSPEKGQLLLIDAMKLAVETGGDVRLILAGDGDSRPMIERRIDENGLRSRVTITGYISEAEVRRHLQAARALVLPSFAEGLPMVIMEAFASGRPVIGTYVAGIPELVRPGENGWLVPAGNATALAEAIGEVMRTPSERLQQMGLNGQERVRQQHYLATEVDKLEKLLLASHDRRVKTSSEVPPSAGETAACTRARSQEQPVRERI